MTRRDGVEAVVAGRTLRLTRLDRVLWPDVGFTKRDLIAYHLAVAPALLPHLPGRAVTLARFHGREVVARLARLGDLFRPALGGAQPIAPREGIAAPPRGDYSPGA